MIRYYLHHVFHVAFFILGYIGLPLDLLLDHALERFKWEKHPFRGFEWASAEIAGLITLLVIATFILGVVSLF